MNGQCKPLVFVLLAGFAVVVCTHFRYTVLDAGRRTWKVGDVAGLYRNGRYRAQRPEDAARNATLGFEKILALSRGTPWRVDGLRAAAERTQLRIDIPAEAPEDEDKIRALQLAGPEGAIHANRGQAVAWAQHLNMLRYVLMAGFETALIVEDDVDWAVEIKDQMALTSTGLRNYTGAHVADPTPFGTMMASNWDVLWIGHCGEVWAENDIKNNTLSWSDSTTVPRAHYQNSWAVDTLQDLPQGHRSIYWTQGAICSFAYAVTRRGAEKLLKILEQVAEEAFDVTLQRACQQGREELQCLSVVDELFHHYQPAEEFGESSDIAEEETHANEHSIPKSETRPGSTLNILRSARCDALFNSTCNGLPDDIALPSTTPVETSSSSDGGHSNESFWGEEANTLKPGGDLA